MIPVENKQELPQLNNVNCAHIGLVAPNSFLFDRVDKWADEVWHNGLLTESQKLIEMGYANTPPMSGLIYKTVKEYLAHTISEEMALERIKFDLHAYIRRQLTWFKKNPDINWYDISETPYAQIKADVLSKISV